MKKTNQPQHIGACAIILNKDKNILVGKRKNSYKAGFYGLPGGRIEINEPIYETITREVKEETGLEGLKFSFIGIVRENQENYDFIHFVYMAEVGDQKPKLCEPEKCEGWKYVNINKLSNVLPGHKAGINLFINKQILADLTT